MGETTKIEWTDHTFNPWIGCTKVSPGCANCYAERENKLWRWNGGVWGPGSLRKVTSDANWRKPLQWAKQAQAAGKRAKVFCSSLADVFDHEAPKDARRWLWDLISETHHALDWQLLTKRPEQIRRVIFEDGLAEIFFLRMQCWIGVTAENQEQAEKRVPVLLSTAAEKRFVSCEPLLGALDLAQLRDPDGEDELARLDALQGTFMCDGMNEPRNTPRLDQVICGGESGPGARPMHPDWARSLRDQCTAAGVAYFFKQWGEWAPGECVDATSGIVQTATWFDNRWSFDRANLADDEGHRDDEPDLYRIGKQLAGASLDGQEWKQFPEARR
jgi:protein gp37